MRSACLVWMALYCIVDAVKYDNVDISIRHLDEGVVLESLRRFALSNECKKDVETILTDINEMATNKSLFWTEEKKRNLVKGFASGLFVRFGSLDNNVYVFNSYLCVRSAYPKTLKYYFANGLIETADKATAMQYCLAKSSSGNKPRTYTVCMPQSCNNDDFANLLSRAWNVSGNASETILCHHGRREKYFTNHMNIVAFVVINTVALFPLIAFLCLKISAKEGSHSLPRQTFEAFSLQRTWQRISGAKQSSNKQSDEIHCIHALRVLSVIWVIVGHYFMTSSTFIDNAVQMANHLRYSFLALPITNFTLSVDVFFVISGCLLSFTWFKAIAKTKETQQQLYTASYWLRFYRHRVIRLLPALLAAMFTVTKLFSLFHSEPLWNLHDPALQCPKDGWQNLLFINSIVPNRCMPWTWYIGTEFIFYLFSPIVLLLLYHSPTIACIVCYVLVAFGCCLRAILIFVYSYPPTHMLWFQAKHFTASINNFHEHFYIKPYTRFGPYIIGLLLGFDLATKPHGKTASNTTLKSLAMFLLSFWSFVGVFPCHFNYDHSARLVQLYALIYGSIHRSTFALGISYFIRYCYYKQTTSRAFTRKLANLSYGAYLYHMVTVMASFTLTQFPHTFRGIYEHTFRALATALFAYVISCVYVTIPIEYPCIALERLYTRKKHTRLTNTIANEEERLHDETRV